MKLADILKLAAPLLAADKKPEDLEALIIAADKKTRDSMPGNIGEAKEIEDKKAKDRAARDAAMMKDRKARDEKMSKDRAAKDAKMMKDRKARDAKMMEDRKARDAAMMEDMKMSKDRDDDPEHTNDAMEACDAEMEQEAKDEMEMEGKAAKDEYGYHTMDEDYTDQSDPSTPGGNRAGGKTAIDSAEVDKRIAAAVAARDALHVAQVAVEPIMGKVTFDSADAAYRAALKVFGVDTAGITGAALPRMLKLAKDGAASAAPAPVTMDAAGVSALSKLIPNYGRLK